MNIQAITPNAQVAEYGSGMGGVESAPARPVQRGVSFGGMLLLAALGVVLAIMGVMLLGLAMMGVIWVLAQVPHAANAVLAQLQG